MNLLNPKCSHSAQFKKITDIYISIARAFEINDENSRALPSHGIDKKHQVFLSNVSQNGSHGNRELRQSSWRNMSWSDRIFIWSKSASWGSDLSKG